MSDDKPKAQENPPGTPGEAFKRSMRELGGKYIELGRAMQSDSATLEELVNLSDACGLRLQMGLTSGGPQS